MTGTKGRPRNHEQYAAVMRVIEEWFARYGFAPSIHEIMERTGITSTGTVYFYLEILHKEGYIVHERSPNMRKGRNIRLGKRRMFI